MSDMRDIIASFGSQFAVGAKGVEPLQTPFRRILSCGMGGSSVAGELLSIVREDVVVHWDYGLPPKADSQDLVVCTSWSGNTEETISGFQEAVRLDAPTLVLTTGGDLADQAQHEGGTLLQLPAEPIRPRFGVGYMVGALFAALGMTDRLPTIDAAALEEKGKKLADEIGDRVPVFYAAYPWRKIAGFFKTTTNENAKRHAWASNFPSAAHNELMGWSSSAQQTTLPVLLQDTDDDAVYRRNMEALVAILSPVGYTIPTIQLSGSSPLEKALNGYVLALWASYYLARNAQLDPASQDWIDEFKRLKKTTK